MHSYVFTCSITHFCEYKVSGKDFRKGFKDWCNKRGRIFSSEGEKDYMFKWFCDNHRYGREFSLGGRPRRALVDHIRKYGNKYTKIASEALLENLRCSNLLLMHVYSIIPTFLRASHYVYKVSHNCTNRMFLRASRTPDYQGLFSLETTLRYNLSPFSLFL
jgi:hypothetical protein